MRFIKTFVLHVYIDSDAPERICGNMRPLEETNNYLFKNQNEFEVLLHQLVRKPLKPKMTPSEPDSHSGE